MPYVAYLLTSATTRILNILLPVTRKIPKTVPLDVYQYLLRVPGIWIRLACDQGYGRGVPPIFTPGSKIPFFGFGPGSENRGYPPTVALIL